MQDSPNKKRTKKDWDYMTSREKRRAVIFLCVITFIICGFLWNVFAKDQSPTKNDKSTVTSKEDSSRAAETPPTPPKATYEATIVDYRVMDPATLNVVVSVKNTSAIEGKPSCTVIMRSPSRAYKGSETFGLESPLKAGEETRFNGNVTIKKEGAIYATEGTVQCS